VLDFTHNIIMFIGKLGALSLDIWLIPTTGSVIGYSCVETTVVARENFSTFNAV